MKRSFHTATGGSLFLLMTIALAGQALAAESPAKPMSPPSTVGTGFQFEGLLNGYNGNYDFRFTIFDVPAAGTRIHGSPIVTKKAVPVKNGIFIVALDFGAVFSSSNRRYLNIEVKTAGSLGTYTLISPRTELFPAPQAYYAMQARTVNWSGIMNRPAHVLKRQIWVPAGSWGRTATSTNITPGTKGLKWKSSTEKAGFVVPKPADWDPTTSFTVSIYFALPTSPAASTVRWRMHAGGCEYNKAYATGWDSLDYGATEDAASMAVATAGPYTSIMKVQTWATKWDPVYHGWHFGSGLTTANDFAGNPIWHFEFIRGAGVVNGETYTGEMVVVGAAIDYLALK